MAQELLSLWKADVDAAVELIRTCDADIALFHAYDGDVQEVEERLRSCKENFEDRPLQQTIASLQSIVDEMQGKQDLFSCDCFLFFFFSCFARDLISVSWFLMRWFSSSD